MSLLKDANANQVAECASAAAAAAAFAVINAAGENVQMQFQVGKLATLLTKTSGLYLSGLHFLLMVSTRGADIYPCDLFIEISKSGDFCHRVTLYTFIAFAVSWLRRYSQQTRFVPDGTMSSTIGSLFHA